MVVLCLAMIILSGFNRLRWYIYPYSLRLLHGHWGNHIIAPVPVKQPWSIWIKLTSIKQQQKATVCKLCAYSLGHPVGKSNCHISLQLIFYQSVSYLWNKTLIRSRLWLVMAVVDNNEWFKVENGIVLWLRSLSICKWAFFTIVLYLRPCCLGITCRQW